MNVLVRLPIVPLRFITLHVFERGSFSSARRHASQAIPASDRKAYSHTLVLPKTTMPTRQNNPARYEKEIRQRTSDKLYHWQAADNLGEPFILHDGPPYANGNLHMGHALNKVLKDIINRYKVLRGHKVHFLPGWDCHGLPIEQKALAEIGRTHTTMEPLRIREVARKAASEAINIQKTEMRDLGVMADWNSRETTYRTMDPDYEIRQLKLFQRMTESGYITYRLRPIYYSPSSRTALAESELKYEDNFKSRSIYVGFPVCVSDMTVALRKVWQQACSEVGEKALKLAIWTTTAWSLSGNLGVAVHNAMQYLLVMPAAGDILVISEDRLDAMRQVLGTLDVLGRIAGFDLIGTRYTHRFHPATSKLPRPLVFHSRHVTSASGTGLVHSAPAHGYEDYQAFVEAAALPLELRCPIDDAGCFTTEVVEWSGDEQTRRLVGTSSIGDGIGVMIDLLREDGSLLAEQPFEHRYPCDWKTKEPVIVRATRQWFADVESLKVPASKAMDTVHFHPPQSRKRLESFIMSRAEWCISRQRSWGVPIPVLHDADGNALLSSESMSHIISVLTEKGTDYWWSGPTEDFVAPSHKNKTYRKGNDTLDVWFDSGSSWMLLEEAALRPATLPLANIYLEGSDQHRGWFQSSLLTRLCVTGTPPYSALVTHGFVTDEHGQKMSKSAGNGMSPMDVIHGTKDQTGHGADTLRLWVASVDYHNDVSFGPSAIAQARETLRKLRMVFRFLLANTSASVYKPLEDVELTLVERYILHETSELERTLLEGYEAFTFNRVLQSTNVFVSSTLSAFYLDIIKDTLYCDQIDSTRRQAVIATLQYVLHIIIKVVAPIVPHLAEEVYEAMSDATKPSVFLDHWQPKSPWLDVAVKADMEYLIDLRTHVLSLMADARAAKNLRNPGEAEVCLDGHTDAMSFLQAHRVLLPSIFGSASVKFSIIQEHALWTQTGEMMTGLGTVFIQLRPSRRHQCPRCWLYNAEQADGLCGRCIESVH